MNILHVVNIYFVLPYFIGDQFTYFKERGYRMNVALCFMDISMILSVYFENIYLNDNAILN